MFAVRVKSTVTRFSEFRAMAKDLGSARFQQLDFLCKRCLSKLRQAGRLRSQERDSYRVGSARNGAIDSEKLLRSINDCLSHSPVKPGL